MLGGGPSAAHGWQPSTRAHSAWRLTASTAQIEPVRRRHRTEPPPQPCSPRLPRWREPLSRGQLAARQVGLTPRYPRCVASEPSNRGLQSVELNDERVRAGLARLDEMSDAELRELVQGE